MPIPNPHATAATNTSVSAALAREGDAMHSRIDRFFPDPFSRLLREPIVPDSTPVHDAAHAPLTLSFAENGAPIEELHAHRH